MCCEALRWAGSAAAWAVMLLALSSDAEGLTLETLRTGRLTYSNITVISQTRSDVFIKFDGGFANVKVKELAPDDAVRLGYEVVPQKAKTSRQAAVVQSIQADPRFKEVQAVIAQQVGAKLQNLDKRIAWSIAGGLALLYLFFCYCCKLICEKTGEEPGPLVWLPVFQAFPLLKAAGMPSWWFLWLLLPLLNVVAGGVWCVKIARARKKTLLTALMLLLPLTNFLAFLYLAFSGDGEGEPGPFTPKPFSLSY